MTSPLLDISGVSVAFGKAAVVKNVSFRIAPGEIVGIAGESGSGKSTICRAALGLLPQTATVTGDIRLDGAPLNGLATEDWSKLRGRDLSMIFQNPSSHLNPLQTIGRQIAQPMIRHLGLSRATAWEKAIALLEDVGIREPAMRAKCLGFSDRVTLFRHVLPNAFGPVVAYAVSDAVLAMLAGASFGFLGMGAQPPLAEWGVMISDGTRFLRQAWWICTFPGLAAISLGLGLIFLGDGLTHLSRQRAAA